MLSFLKYRIRLLLKNRVSWSGDFSSWTKAADQCRGYDADNILEKVQKSTLEVKHGSAVYERDSVLFDKIEYSFPLLASLLWVSSLSEGTLSVLDFGGALGSSYYQNRNFLTAIKRLHWTIVEQGSFVKAGRELISDDILHFELDLQSAVTRYQPNLLVLACTLPYIEKPYELIDEICAQKIPYLILDNTPFNFENRDRLTIQKVPPSIYQASYPCWFLDYSSVLKRFAQHYNVITEFINDTNIELDGRTVPYRGFLLELKQLA